jgi:hypothetical protein
MTRHWPEIACVALAAAVALLGAMPFAQGFNDGSRLATVESLGEQGTFAIDDSLFVRPHLHPERPNPYNPRIVGVCIVGTLDMVRIGDRFYSDKPPVPALILGGMYRLWLRCGGAPAAYDTGAFCSLCTLLSSGVPFILAVFAMGRMARDLGFSACRRFTFAFSFGFCTLAVVYSRQVNGHIQLLGAASIVYWQLVRLAEDSSWKRLVMLGTFAGLGFTLDLGIGPILLALMIFAVAGTTRSPRGTGLVFAAALPWLVLHFALNYGLGRTFAPLGAVMEYLDYPGSAFGPHNATGTWKHDSFAEFAEYACGLLFGNTGFLTFNPVLMLALSAAIWLLWKSQRVQTFLLVVACGWPLLAWLMYTVTSNNYSGSCCSTRWFLPLIAPGYLLIGILLKERPRFQFDFLWLSAVGGTIVEKVFGPGPWEYHSVGEIAPALAIGAAGWLAIRLSEWRR